jgi:hypothetical protein
MGKVILFKILNMVINCLNEFKMRGDSVKLNKLILMLVVTFAAVLVVGCSSGINAAQKVTQENAATVSEGQKVALPEEQPALTGKVKEIVGNEVTVYKAEANPNEETPKEEPLSEEARDKLQAIREKVQNGTITSEQAKEEMDKLGIQPGPTRNPMKFTEETETFIIPVGTPIVTMQRGSNEANQVELTEIKKDTVLRIWKNGDAVSFVQVIGGSGQRGTGQGTNGQGPGFGGDMPPDMGGGPPPGGGPQ